ncbi:MAG: 3-hydroxyacyl-CoA dehydrogenase [Bacteroidetes bacterium B1(2017)]|nr:MAG: 3-hydroxyacyl-CoA dehydrogenase [Bacteroidetes bacterium B1(2017)]
MKILARGSKNRIKELQEKLNGVSCVLTCVDDSDLISANVHQFDLIFDLKFDEKSEQLHYYAGLKNIPVFVCAVKQQLAKATFDFGRKVECKLFGINALPTFLNRPLTEISLLHQADESSLKEIMHAFSWNYRIVEDRVGMITPRILFMIINEACYTLQEGTASMEDIDTSMKLGTNYPLGPFEWANKIGIKHVYETLEAIYQDTHDERYKVCSLLKTKYLKDEEF